MLKEIVRNATQAGGWEKILAVKIFWALKISTGIFIQLCSVFDLELSILIPYSTFNTTLPWIIMIVTSSHLHVVFQVAIDSSDLSMTNDTLQCSPQFFRNWQEFFKG